MRGIGLLEPAEAGRLLERQALQGQATTVAIESGAREDSLRLMMTDDEAQQPAHV